MFSVFTVHSRHNVCVIWLIICCYIWKKTTNHLYVESDIQAVIPHQSVCLQQQLQCDVTKRFLLRNNVVEKKSGNQWTRCVISSDFYQMITKVVRIHVMTNWIFNFVYCMFWLFRQMHFTQNINVGKLGERNDSYDAALFIQYNHVHYHQNQLILLRNQL